MLNNIFTVSQCVLLRNEITFDIKGYQTDPLSLVRKSLKIKVLQETKDAKTKAKLHGCEN